VLIQTTPDQWVAGLCGTLAYPGYSFSMITEHYPTFRHVSGELTSALSHGVLQKDTSVHEAGNRKITLYHLLFQPAICSYKGFTANQYTLRGGR